MSAFVGLGSASKIRANVPYKGPCQLRPTQSKLGAELYYDMDGDRLPPALTSASGKDAGEHLDGVIIPPNKVAKLELGTLHLKKFNALVEVNPAFFETASVSAPHIIEPGEEVPLNLTIQARSSVDLAALSWFVRIYILD